MEFHIIAILFLTLSPGLNAIHEKFEVNNGADKPPAKELSGRYGSKDYLKVDTSPERIHEESLVKELIKESVIDILRQVEALNAEVEKQNVLIQELKEETKDNGNLIDEMKTRIKDLEGDNKRCAISEDVMTKKAVMDDMKNLENLEKKLPEEERNNIITLKLPRNLQTLMSTNTYDPSRFDDRKENGRSNSDERIVPSGRGVRNFKWRSNTSESEQIAFNVYLTKGIKEQDLEQNLTVPFDKAVVNLGNAYNNKTGIFTAPVNGTYFFHFRIVSNMMGLAYAYLVKNGQKQVFSILNPPNSSFVGRSIELLSLKEGDKVCVEIMYDAPVEIKADSQLHITAFSGFLLFQ